VQIKISLNGYTVRAIVNHVISRLIAIPTGFKVPRKKRERNGRKGAPDTEGG